MRPTRRALHGLLRLHAGNSYIEVDGVHVVPMIPINHLYNNPVELRRILDADGFLYFKNLVSRESMRRAYADVCAQLEANEWWSREMEKQLYERDGFVFGAASPAPVPLPVDNNSSSSSSSASSSDFFSTVTPAPLPNPRVPFHITDSVSRACFGPSVLGTIRQVFGGGAECLNYNTLDLAPTGERGGFFMPSVYMNQGTKLVLTAWVALHDMPLNVGGICCVKGSNSAASFKKVRETYGQHEVETGDIRGDGTLTEDPVDMWNLGGGECPLAVSSFEPGDVVLSTVYTAQAFPTNTSAQWRVSAQSRWVMHGDDVGADPRFATAPSAEQQQDQQEQQRNAKENPQQGMQLTNWMLHRDDPARYPRTMEQARRDWGIAPMF